MSSNSALQGYKEFQVAAIFMLLITASKFALFFQLSKSMESYMAIGLFVVFLGLIVMVRNEVIKPKIFAICITTIGLVLMFFYLIISFFPKVLNIQQSRDAITFLSCLVLYMLGRGLSLLATIAK
jgi:cytochrome bd-type quinol oxidase subunit 2